MAIQIPAAGAAVPASTVRPTDKTAGGGAAGFSEALSRLVESVETSTGDANAAVSSMLNKSGDVHDAMIALQRAEMSLQFTVQVRNKLVQAYHDIMRMSV